MITGVIGRGSNKYGNIGLKLTDCFSNAGLNRAFSLLIFGKHHCLHLTRVPFSKKNLKKLVFTKQTWGNTNIDYRREAHGMTFLLNMFSLNLLKTYFLTFNVEVAPLKIFRCGIQGALHWFLVSIFLPSLIFL